MGKAIRETEGFVSSALGCCVAYVRDRHVVLAIGSKQAGIAALSPANADRFADALKAAAREARGLA